MSGPRAMISFVNRYASMAGKTCCAGRSWVGLNRSLARHEAEAGGCRREDAPDKTGVRDPEADETTFVSTSPR